MKRIIGIILSVLLFAQSGYSEYVSYSDSIKSASDNVALERKENVSKLIINNLDSKEISCTWFFVPAMIASFWGSYELQKSAESHKVRVVNAEQQFNNSVEWQDRLYWKVRTNELNEEVKDKKALSFYMFDIGLMLTFLSYRSIKSDVKRSRDRKLQMQVTSEGYEVKLQKRF